MSPQNRKFSGSGYNRTDDDDDDDEADNAKRRYDEGVLRIQAYEVDIVRGPMVRVAAVTQHDDCLDVGFGQTGGEEIWVDRYDVCHSALLCKEMCYGNATICRSDVLI
jgi:hypothetical protein